MITQDNPYEGIHFFPTVNRFAATVGSGPRPQILGYFGSLQEAIDARAQALVKPLGWQGARETAAIHHARETRNLQHA